MIFGHERRETISSPVRPYRWDRMKSKRSTNVFGLSAIASFLALGVGLVACGGGGPGTESSTADSGAGTAGGLSSTPMWSGSFDNRKAVVCGQELNADFITGVVMGVHDGDTITISGNPSPLNIRLEGIDAPELAQPYGPQSRDALSAQLSGKTVIVAHRRNDAYGRVIGSVFTTADCQYANHGQLDKGLAWFYSAYQCELNQSQRSIFQAAEQQARMARRGLWAVSSPQAPWEYRNGVAPTTPTCSSDSPVYPPTSSASGGMVGAYMNPPAVQGAYAAAPVLPISGGGGTGGGGAGVVSCATKKSCGDFKGPTACEEAKSYMKQCNRPDLDQDKDGIPCEALCRS